MKKTSNYGLSLYEKEDQMIITAEENSLNANMIIIDNILKENATPTQQIPSPNLVNINDTESWPFGISETESVKGLYSWVDSEGYVNIKGTTTESNTLFFMFADGDTTFEPGTYYICFDDILRKTEDASTTIDLNGVEHYLQLNEKKFKSDYCFNRKFNSKKN